MYHFLRMLCFFLIISKFDCVRTTRCYFYNNNNTCHGGKHCDGIEEVQECSGRFDHCYVLWTVSPNKTTKVELKGCFQSTGGSGDCIGDPECVDKGQKRRNDVLFCCCRGELCNKNFTWNPTPAPPPTSITSVDETRYQTNSDETVTYLAYVLFPLSFLLLMLMMYLLKKRKDNHLIRHFISKPVPSMDAQSFPSTIIKIPFSIELKEVVASGKFGAVQKALLDKKEIVAVKKIPIQEKQSWITEQEVYSLPLMNHDNILRFIGAERRDHEYWIITAYHELGSLQNFLTNNTISWEQLCHIAYTMARGLMYLHEEIPSKDMTLYKPAVAHRDFKSSNVLLKSDLTACIADFGLALIFRPSRSCGDTHGQVGTRRYMAPEVLEGAINFSRDAFLRIDMYACGLVLWELASRCHLMGPVPSYKLPFEKEIGSHPTLEAVQDAVVHQKLRPVIPATWKNHPGMTVLSDTMQECWDHDAEARLSASCVTERIPW